MHWQRSSSLLRTSGLVSAWAKPYSGQWLAECNDNAAAALFGRVTSGEWHNQWVWVVMQWVVMQWVVMQWVVMQWVVMQWLSFGLFQHCGTSG